MADVVAGTLGPDADEGAARVEYPCGRTPSGRTPSGSAPLLGADTDTVLREFGIPVP
jgi:hypothetical protein